MRKTVDANKPSVVKRKSNLTKKQQQKNPTKQKLTDILYIKGRKRELKQILFSSDGSMHSTFSNDNITICKNR